jgi:hypothetical protein
MLDVFAENHAIGGSWIADWDGGMKGPPVIAILAVYTGESFSTVVKMLHSTLGEWIKLGLVQEPRPSDWSDLGLDGPA